MKKYKNLILIGVIVFVILLFATSSYAAVQSSGDEAVSYDLNSWIKTVRQMETVGGGFGLTETLNSNLTSSSGSNNIDVHMEKNTEYGAAAILSASSYGNPSIIADGETTTGNKSGMVMKINQEWVAAGTASYAATYYGANAKYKNVHNLTYVRQVGDAITETSGWHGSTASTWISAGDTANNRWYPNTTKAFAGLLRAYSGSIFSYYGYAEYNHYYHGDDPAWSKPSSVTRTFYPAYYGKAHPTRCVVVVGEGI